MMTSSNGNISALLAICAGNSTMTGEFPAERPVTQSFDVFFDLHLNKRLSKQWWDWWFETPWRPLWRHSNDSPNCSNLPWLLQQPLDLWRDGSHSRFRFNLQFVLRFFVDPCTFRKLLIYIVHILCVLLVDSMTQRKHPTSIFAAPKKANSRTCQYHGYWCTGPMFGHASAAILLHMQDKHVMIFHDMMTSSKGNIFRVTCPLCGEFIGQFPTQRPVTRSFDVFFDLRPNKQLSKHWWGWWFETPPCPL